MNLGGTNPSLRLNHGGTPAWTPKVRKTMAQRPKTTLSGLLFGSRNVFYNVASPSTPRLAFKRPQIPSNRYHTALNRGTLGGLGLSPGSSSPSLVVSAGTRLCDPSATSRLWGQACCWDTTNPSDFLQGLPFGLFKGAVDRAPLKGILIRMYL